MGLQTKWSVHGGQYDGILKKHKERVKCVEGAGLGEEQQDVVPSNDGAVGLHIGSLLHWAACCSLHRLSRAVLTLTLGLSLLLLVCAAFAAWRCRPGWALGTAVRP